MKRQLLSPLKLFLSLFFWINLPCVYAANLFFFIAGDASFIGPHYKDGTIEGLLDQSEETFKRAKKIAQNDRENNVIIFYDPKGSGRGLFVKKQYAEFLIYEKGKLVYSFKKREVDSTDPMHFFELVTTPGLYLNENYPLGPNVLFYYGEQITSKLAPYDLSHLGKHHNLNQFATGLEFFHLIGGIDLFIAQSCYLNRSDFFNQTAHLIKRFVVPQNGILNTALNLSTFKRPIEGADIDFLAREFIQDQGEHPFNFNYYEGDRISLISSLISKIFEEIKNGHTTDAFRPLKEGQQVAKDKRIFPAGEVLVSTRDFANFAESLLGEAAQIGALWRLLKEKKQYRDLWVPLHQYAPPVNDRFKKRYQLSKTLWEQKRDLYKIKKKLKKVPRKAGGKKRGKYVKNVPSRRYKKLKSRTIIQLNIVNKTKDHLKKALQRDLQARTF